MTELLQGRFNLCLLIFVFGNGGITVAAQPPTEPIDCATAEKLTRPKRSSLVSFGVLNGQAIDLVKPAYPVAAKSIDVRGTVIVQVLIDPRGCVSEAKVVSGHPLLRAASMDAARRSSFEPIKLGGVAIWISGVITYNYVSDSANWLEIGFFSDSPEKLIEYLPAEFERFRTELKAAQPLPYRERQTAINATLDSISVELMPLPKDRWLFDLGRRLSDTSQIDAGAIKELETIVDIAPTTVSPELIRQLNKLIGTYNSGDFFKELREFETRISQLGN